MKQEDKKCGNCIFCEAVQPNMHSVDVCRRYPPPAKKYAVNEVDKEKDWCGEWSTKRVTQ